MYSEIIIKTYDKIKTELVWKAWADVNNWPRWDTELAYCDLTTPFQASSQFLLKPKNGPKVKITLAEVVPNKRFTATCRFLGATMTHVHELNGDNEKLEIKHIISLAGPFSFIWNYLVVKHIVKAVPVQTDNMIEYISRGMNE